MAKDIETLAHQEWLGYIQPVGLVVSIPALLAAQAHVNRNIAPDHQRFLACLLSDKHDEIISEIPNFEAFAQHVLGWDPGDLMAIPQEGTLPVELTSLEIALPEYHETLRPTHAVRQFESKDPKHPWLMLVQTLPSGTDIDEVAAKDSRHWHTSPMPNSSGFCAKLRCLSASSLTARISASYMHLEGRPAAT
jgi:hypothetical protein